MTRALPPAPAAVGADETELITLADLEPGDASPFASEIGQFRSRLGRWWDDHPRLLRALAVISLGWSAAYLLWRFGWSWRGAHPVTWLLLLLCELYGTWSLSTLAWFSWHPSGPVRPVTARAHSVDIYVCTYNEPIDVLAATLAGCRAVPYPHVTWLLDDGRRPEMADLARRFGAGYLTRPDNLHAKAGNLNHALQQTGGDLVLVLDADHVPLPDILDALVGYFDDPRLAVVQTPHDFFNLDSFQHYGPHRHEQSVFYEVICPGKDRHGAAFWCGSAALIRRAALLEVGGVATETIAEDFHTTIKMQRAGWRSRYHHEYLVQGLGPHDLAGYLLQRDRWARGNLSVFRTPESPLRARELTFHQRLSYFTSLAAYLAGPVRALQLAVLGVSALAGWLPMRAGWLTIAVLWAPATGLNLLTGSALCRGYMKVREATHYELCTAGIYLRALRCLVKPGKTTFKVTPKEGLDLGGWENLRQLPLVLGLAGLLGLAFALNAADLAGVPLPRPELPGLAAWLLPALCLVELRRVIRTLSIVSRRRQRRRLHRFRCDLPGHLLLGDAAATVRVVDLSPAGAALITDAAVEPGAEVRLRVGLANRYGDAPPRLLPAIVRSSRPHATDETEPNCWHVGVEITPSDAETFDALMEFCFVICPWVELRDKPIPVMTHLPLTPSLALQPVSHKPRPDRPVDLDSSEETLTAKHPS